LGKVPGTPVIEANKKTLIPLAISVSGLAMVKDITEIITRGSDAAYTCGGNLNLGGGLPGMSDFNMPFNFTGNTKLKK
jgi:hypothetical protein